MLSKRTGSGKASGSVIEKEKEMQDKEPEVIRWEHWPEASIRLSTKQFRHQRYQLVTRSNVHETPLQLPALPR